MSSNLDRQRRLDEKDDDTKQVVGVPFRTCYYDSDGDDEDEYVMNLTARLRQQRMRRVTYDKQNEQGDDEDDDRKPPAKPSQRESAAINDAVACPPVEDEKALYRRQVDMANVILSQHAAMGSQNSYPSKGMAKLPGAIAVRGLAGSDREDRIQAKTEERSNSERSTRTSGSKADKSTRSLNDGRSQPGAEYVPQRAHGLTTDSIVARQSASARSFSSHSHRSMHVVANAVPVVSPPARQPIPIEPTASNQLKWRKTAILGVLVVVVVIVAVVLGVLLGTKGQDDNGSASSPTSSSQPAPFTFDCSVIPARPHVITQCHCIGTISNLTAETVVSYGTLRENFIPTFDPDFNYTMGSCDPRNQALVWLAGDRIMAKLVMDSFKMRQRYNLALLFLLWNGPTWRVYRGWLSFDDECTWIGLSCDDLGKVVQLSLGQNNILGNFAPVTSLLTNLVSLELTNNDVNGSIPSQIELLTSLQTLVLSASRVSGTIPSELFELGTSLKFVDFSLNPLTGGIPTLIGHPTVLEQWIINRNSLNGTIPSEIGICTRLTLFDVKSNNIHGTIPS